MHDLNTSNDNHFNEFEARARQLIEDRYGMPYDPATYGESTEFLISIVLRDEARGMVSAGYTEKFIETELRRLGEKLAIWASSRQLKKPN